MERSKEFSSLIIQDPLFYTKDENLTKVWNECYNSTVQDNRNNSHQMETASAGKSQHDFSLSSVEKKSSKDNKMVKRKILPSTDLLGDCEIDPTLKFLQSNAESAVPVSLPPNDGRGEVTPDSPTTPEYFDSDDVFDNDLEGTVESPTSSQGTSVSGRRQISKEREENERWRTVLIGNEEHRIDLKVIEPYKRVISHGGYYGDGFNSIVVLTVCYLPDKRRHDYHYVMRNLFLYVISTLELLVMDEYTVVYFHGAAPRQKVPSFRWLRQIYEMIDRKFKKNLNRLLIVHPTFFLRTVMLMTKPFLSPKFYTKLKYVRGLEELGQLLPMEHVYIPKEIRAYDAERSDKSSIGSQS